MGWEHRVGIGWKSIQKAWQAWGDGHRQGKIKGDPKQQGGEAIILQDGTIWWSHPANEAGTHCPLETVKNQIDRFVAEMG